MNHNCTIANTETTGSLNKIPESEKKSVWFISDPYPYLYLTL